MLALAQLPAPAPSLLDVVARAPGAAALIVEALGPEERRALRLEHSSLRDAVDETTKKLTVTLQIEAADAAAAAAAVDARPPTALRWPRLESLTLAGRPWLASDLDALGPAPWEGLQELRFHEGMEVEVSDDEEMRALAAAAARMPALRALHLGKFLFREEDARVLLGAGILSRLEELSLILQYKYGTDAVVPALAAAWRAVPRLRALHLGMLEDSGIDTQPEDIAMVPRALAAAGWRLEALTLAFLDDAGVVALAGAPSFVLRYLKLNYWSVGADGLQALAGVRWPLRELVLADCDDVGIGHAFEVLGRLPGLRELRLEHCSFTEATYESLLCANLPTLTCLCINFRCMVDFPDISPAGLFAGFPNLKELDLGDLYMGKEGARLLASRIWRRLRDLRIDVDDEGLAELARGACRWPALTRLSLDGPKVSLKKVRRWAPRVRARTFWNSSY